MHKPDQWRPRGRARRYYGQRCGPHAIATPRPSGPRRPGRQHIPVRSGCNNPTDGRRRPGSRSRGLPGADHQLHPHRAATPWVSPDRGIRAAQRGHRDRPGARILHHRPRRGRRRPTNDASDCRAARRARHAGPTLAEQPSHLRQRRDSAITTPATQGARIWKIWVKLPARTARLSCAQNRRCADVGTTPITSGVATVSAVRASAYRSSGYARQIAGRGNPHA